MSGLGGLNPPTGGLVLGLVQSAVPWVDGPDDVRAAADRVAGVMARSRDALPAPDLLVFPEYSLHGLDPATWLDDRMLCDVDGPEVAVLRKACATAGAWGCFSIMERNATGAPFNTGLIVDDAGEIRLHYRKLHPWVPAEPWAPGDLGLPVCPGPRGSTLGLVICHDGMLPETAREVAYRGANVILRTAGYTYPIEHAWRITNQANAFCNLAYTASVCLAGPDRFGIHSQGAAMVCDVDGTVLADGDGQPDRVVTAAVVPSRADEARRGWGVENNIHQLGHRGYVAIEGGATDCPYTWVTDLAAGRYRVPWDAEVAHTDGTGAGWGPPAAVRAAAQSRHP